MNPAQVVRYFFQAVGAAMLSTAVALVSGFMILSATFGKSRLPPQRRGMPRRTSRHTVGCLLPDRGGEGSLPLPRAGRRGAGHPIQAAGVTSSVIVRIRIVVVLILNRRTGRGSPRALGGRSLRAGPPAASSRSSGPACGRPSPGPRHPQWWRWWWPCRSRRHRR